MFSFHKPRVYRSTEGCCICRAKSSSSRFTDSKKYEDDSMKCFNLDKPRQGEICNACVLLVKRYKRLPTGSNRHWGHVVDARIGPGMKSMTKFRKLREENESNQQSSSGRSSNSTESKTTKTNFPEKFSKIFKKKKHLNKIKVPINNNDNINGTYQSWNINHHQEDQSSLSPTSDSNNIEFDEFKPHNFGKKLNRRKILKPKKNSSKNFKNISFIDENLWKIRKICCGFAYENININAIIIDLENFQPCKDHNKQQQQQQLSTPSSIKIKCNILHSQSNNKSDNIDNILPPPPLINNKVIIRNSSLNNLNTNINKATAATSSTLATTTALKKHHMFLKRQSESYSTSLDSNNINSSGLKTDITTNNNEISIIKSTNIKKHNEDLQHLQQQLQNKTSILHKIKSDTGKIIKNSINKINLSVRLNPNEMREIVKNTNPSTNPMNIKKIDSSKLIFLHNKNLNELPANKFSDNSSDSGFDENLLDRKSVSPLSDDVEKDKKHPNIQSAQKLYLSNGIYVQGQQQNLILTGNEVASKILQRRHSHMHNTKY